MGKKMIGIIAVIAVLVIVLIVAVQYKNNQALGGADNPYGKTDLEQETIDLLDDPLYQNQIVSEDLSERLDNGEDLIVYFFSPTCVYCRQTTPILMPVAEDNNIEIVMLNLLEFQDEWNKYGIESTPTLVYFKDGEEEARIVGQHEAEEFQAFFDSYVLND